MNDWKKVLMFGAFGAAAYLLITGKRKAGFAACGVGLAALSAEYPQHFEQIWNEAPDYLERGHRLVNGVQSLLDRVAEHASTIQGLRGGGRGEYRASR